MVIGDFLSIEQTTFIKDKQFFDGPLMVNEILEWYKKKKKKNVDLKN